MKLEQDSSHRNCPEMYVWCTRTNGFRQALSENVEKAWNVMGWQKIIHSKFIQCNFPKPQ